MIGELVLGYLFLGGVVFMLLVDQFLAKARVMRASKPATVVASFMLILQWPLVIPALARGAFESLKEMGWPWKI